MAVQFVEKPEAIRVILRDGHTFKVRPITHDDKNKLRNLFYRLSPQSRYLRFGYMKEHISDQELDYYTNVRAPESDAFIGLTGEGEEEEIRAVGRWFLTPDKSVAEIAFVVEDNIQARGIGTALLERIAGAAVKYRIKTLVAHVLPDNIRMLRVFEESGFAMTKRMHEGFFEITFDLDRQEEFSKRQALREHISRSLGMRRMMYPRTIAVIGASRDSESVGGKVFRNLLYNNFGGAVFPVNPKSTAINGVMSYPSVSDIPGDVDLAVVVVPANRVLEVVDECGKKGWAMLTPLPQPSPGQDALPIEIRVPP